MSVRNIGEELINDFQTAETTMTKYINVVDPLSGEEKPVMSLYCNIRKNNTINYSVTVLDEALFAKCSLEVIQSKIDSFKAECQEKASQLGMVYVS